MSEPHKPTRRFWIAGLFLVALLGLNLFPPRSNSAPWKDPFLVVLAFAMLAILLAPRKKQ